MPVRESISTYRHLFALSAFFFIINYVLRSCVHVHGSYAPRPHGDGCTWYWGHKPGCRLTGPPLPGPHPRMRLDTVQFLSLIHI